MFVAAYLAIAILIIWFLAPGISRWLVVAIAFGWPVLLAAGLINEIQARRNPPKSGDEP